MDDQLVDLIGANDGDEIMFDTWVSAANAAKLNFRSIQNLKRRKRVHTRLDENGNVWIVRGARVLDTETQTIQPAPRRK